MKIQTHKRKLLVGATSEQAQKSWDQNYDSIFARCPLCHQGNGESTTCLDPFHAPQTAANPST